MWCWLCLAAAGAGSRAASVRSFTSGCLHARDCRCSRFCRSGTSVSPSLASCAGRTRYEAVSLLSWRGHVAVIAASLLLAVAIARFLAAETQAAWPHLDASTMVLSLFASWLTARGKVENWLYWIVIDAVQAWLYAAQGLIFTAFLFLTYLVIASIGFIEWSKTYRRQTVG